MTIQEVIKKQWNQPPQKCYTSKPTKVRTVTHFLSIQSQT